MNFLNKMLAGFSMLEASITMLIVGIFVAMCANAYTKRHVTYQESDGHGRYECYKNGSTTVQRYVENNRPRDVAGSTCVFSPPRYAKYFLIAVTGGGTSSNAGKFDTLFYTSINEPITIIPGGVGGSTTIKLGSKTIHTSAGGAGSFVVTSSAAESIASCTLTSELYSCGTTTSCYKSGSNINVVYCFDDSTSQTVQIPIADVKANRYSYSGDTITYKDLSSYTDRGFTASEAVTMLQSCSGEGCLEVKYIMNVKFNMQNEQESQKENYQKALDIQDGIATASPGAKGKGGGALVLW